MFDNRALFKGRFVFVYVTVTLSSALPCNSYFPSHWFVFFKDGGKAITQLLYSSFMHFTTNNF